MPPLLVHLRTLLLLGAVLLLAACGDGNEPPFHNTDITGAGFGAEFPAPLTDHRGQLRQLKDFRGKVVILFFGYTHCPDVCPTTLARFAETVKQLGPAGGQVQVLFLSIDPERDTPARLAEYVPWFNPTFIGLSGSPQTVAATVKEFRIYAARQEVGGSLGYVMDHTAGAYVFDPAGRLRLFVKDDAPLDGLVADLRRLIDS